MKALTLRAQEFADAAGTAGVIGLGLLAFAAAFGAAMLLPLHHELEAAQARYERMQARWQAAASREPSGSGPEAELAAFLKHFPPADDARQDILRLQAIAAGHGIELLSGEYRFVPETGTGLVRHQVSLPVAGSYLDIRAFVTEALRVLPAAALQSLSFKRDSLSARQVEGRLQFVLYTAGS